MSIEPGNPFSLTRAKNNRRGDRRGRCYPCTLLAVLLLSFAGCSGLQHPAVPASSRGDTAFDEIARDYLEGYLGWRPQTGTALGLHQYDGQVTDLSSKSLAGELKRLRAFDQRLSAMDTNGLSTGRFYDFRILRGAVQREIFGFEQARIYTHNPMTYAGVLDVNIYIKRDFAPLHNRIRSVISILQQAPGVFAAARTNLDPVLPRAEVETAMEMAGGAADFLGKDLVAALMDVKNEALMAEFNRANQEAIRELRGYVDWLKREKLPQSDDSFALGRDKYAKLLECGEMVSLPPDEILAIGMRDLARENQVFRETARVIDPGKTPLEVYRSIQKDHPAAERLIPDTARNLELIRQFVVDHHIIRLPSPVRAQVAETPQYLRATSFASMDTPGPFETRATQAYYYVTPTEPEWTPQQKEEWLTAFNYYDIDVTSIHEAYPGHYVQFLCLNASRATRLEKIFTSYAFAEGWAHYAEQMLLDEGFGGTTSPAPTREQQLKAAKYRLAQSDEALLRLCRLCVSIKMHCHGMTVEEGTRFFQEFCYFEEKPARQEAIRGTFDPEYLYYTLGKLQILKLRDDYRKQEGTNFTLEKFHNEMLRHGAPPIRLLREILLKDKSSWEQVL